jgi:hypothetical protein
VAVVFMVGAALPLLLLLLVLGLVLFFHAGGTFGGMGGTPLDNYDPQLWSQVLNYGAWLAAVVIDGWVGVRAYRRTVDRLRRRAVPGPTDPATAPPAGTDRPPTSVDGLVVLLGVAGTVGAVVALMTGAGIWAIIVFVGSVLGQVLVVLAQRRADRRTRTS